MTRILIVAGDVLPLPGYPTTGAGLRAWSIGQGLASQGFEVLYSMPEFHVRHNSHSDERDLAWHPNDREKPLRLTRPDVLVVCHWPAMPSRRLDIPVVLDLHGPHLMERCFWDRQEAKRGIMEKIRAFGNADFFVCAGQRQRYYFFNWLMLAGFELESALICVVPVSLSPHMPERVREQDPKHDLTMVYGGMFLPWQDPVQPLLALVKAMEETRRGKLLLFGGPHPIVQDKTGKFDRLLEQLGQHERVTIMPPVAHDLLLEHYSRAHIAFDLMGPNFERELAYTTRTIEYLWCGLPVIYNDYSELSPLIKKYDAGWLLPTSDDDRTMASLRDILAAPEPSLEKSSRARQLVRECLTWDKAIKPLADYCRAPFRTLPSSPLLPEQTPARIDKSSFVTRLKNMLHCVIDNK